MSLNVVLVGDHLEHPIDTNNEQDKLLPYIEQYKNCLDSLVASQLTRYDNNSMTTYTDLAKNQYFIIPKTTSLLTFFQRSLPGTNVLIYFINMNEQKNYPFEILTKWNTSLNQKKFELHPSNPHHVHKSYQLFQRMIIGLPHFMYPPKYLCLVFCGAQQLNQFNDRKKFIMDTYSQIIYEKCKWDKRNTLFIEDVQFNDGSIPSNTLHTKLINMIQTSISENAPQIISNPERKNDDNTNQDEKQNLIASIFDYIITEIKHNEYAEFILFCAILNGVITKGDILMLYPANIEVEILEMRNNGRQKIKFAPNGSKMSVKIRIASKVWKPHPSSTKHKILHRSKHLLVSKDCIDSFKWKTIKVDITHYWKDKVYRSSEMGIEMKTYLSSRNNYQWGIFRNQELMISYLGHVYAANVVHFGDTQPSIDTILEWKVVYDIVNKQYKLKLSNDCIRIIFEYIFTMKEHNMKVGLLQNKYLNINVDPVHCISFSTVKPFNKFCILSRNEIVAKGKFVSFTKIENLSFDSTIFNLTALESSLLLKWIPNIRHYSKIQLIYRASRDGFDTASFKAKCVGMKSTLCIIQNKDTQEIFGGFHEYEIPSNYRYSYGNYGGSGSRTLRDPKSFVFLLRMNNVKPLKLKFKQNTQQYPYIWNSQTGAVGIRFGKTFYLSNNCNQNFSQFGWNETVFQHPVDIDKWDGSMVPNQFKTRDYEIWQLVKY